MLGVLVDLLRDNDSGVSADSYAFSSLKDQEHLDRPSRFILSLDLALNCICIG